MQKYYFQSFFTAIFKVNFIEYRTSSIALTSYQTHTKPFISAVSLLHEKLYRSSIGIIGARAFLFAHPFSGIQRDQHSRLYPAKNGYFIRYS